MKYKVCLETTVDGELKKEVEAEWTKEHLEKIIGRLTLRYGAPIEVDTNKNGFYMFEFYKKFSNGEIIVMLECQKEGVGGKTGDATEKPKQKTFVPVVVAPPPPKVEVPPVETPAFMLKFVDEKVFTKCS